MTRHDAIAVLLPEGASYETPDMLREVLLERAGLIGDDPSGRGAARVLAAGIILGMKQSCGGAWMGKTASYWDAHAKPVPDAPEGAVRCEWACEDGDACEAPARAVVLMDGADPTFVFVCTTHYGSAEREGAFLHGREDVRAPTPSPEPEPEPEPEWRGVAKDLAETEHGVIWRDQHGTMHVVFDHRSDDAPHFRIRALLPGGLILEECVAPDA